MSTGNGSELRRLAQPGEGRKFAQVVFISAAGFGIGDVGEPFKLGRNIGEIAELRRRHRAPFNRNQILGHHPPPCAPVFLLRRFWRSIVGPRSSLPARDL
jgi:hypothetical protein